MRRAYSAVSGFVDVILSATHDADHSGYDPQWQHRFHPSHIHLLSTPFAFSLAPSSLCSLFSSLPSSFSLSFHFDMGHYTLTLVTFKPNISFFTLIGLALPARNFMGLLIYTIMYSCYVKR